LSWIDLVLALVIGISMLAGFSAGFARVGVGFAAMIVGMFSGFWFYGIVAAYVIDYVNSPAIANLIGFFVILTAVMILLAFSPSPPPRSVVDSQLLPYVINVSDVLAALTPHEIKDQFYATKDKVKAVWSAHNTPKTVELRHE
jgi:uncharacterized membrane protein required for colicin V production